MIEHSILSLFIKEPDLFDKYSKALNLEFIKINYPVLFRLFKSLPATSFDELEAKYLTNYPVIKDGDREIVSNLIKIVGEIDVNKESIVNYLEQHLGRAWANDLALVALDVAEGKKHKDTLLPIIERGNVSVDELNSEEDECVTTSLEELSRLEEESPGLTWKLKCLRQSLGPIRTGNLIHIAARIETGKTALWVSEGIHMAQQIKPDENICIFFNEENPEDVIWRMYSSLSGKTYMELRNNLAYFEKMLQAKMGNKIKFFRAEYVSKNKIEKLVEKYKPSLIIVDNADKTLGFEGEREDIRLHNIYKWYRHIAQTYAPTITVGQADFTGANQKIITESQLAGGKTGKPSEMDGLITIGKIDKEGYENVRFLSTPRNKLRGSKETVAAMRHMRGYEVILDSEVTQYKDL